MPLAAVLLKAVAPRPADRYASAAALAADLRRWLRGEPVSAQPPTPWTRATRWIVRHPIAVTVAVCLACVVSALGASVATIHWLNRLPNRFILDDQGHRWASLVSRSGNVLQTWSGMKEDSVPMAEIIGGSFSSKSLAAVWFPLHLSHAFDGREIAVYRLSDPSNLLWVTPGTDPIRIPPPIDRPNEQWSVGAALLADVFDEAPGEELIVVHRIRYSQRAIRIYSLAWDRLGALLFEAWHDGSCDHVAWFPQQRLIAFAGDNHERNTPEWGSVDLETPLPLVVFAVRPDFGGRHAWIHGPAAAPADRAVVAWYRSLEPVAAWAGYVLRLVAPLRGAPPGMLPDIRIVHNTGSTVTFQLLPDGTLSAQPVVSDQYRRLPDALDPASFRLADFRSPGR